MDLPEVTERMKQIVLSSYWVEESSLDVVFTWSITLVRRTIGQWPETKVEPFFILVQQTDS